mmetsp:Transcript_6378/g.17383  ORF Transcript_6378/g.17383 Transcript_6378/m.17383 type:complete len:387 (-) Transcript_6378:658-1818(-)
MPIDLKIIRTSPDIVKQWQVERGLDAGSVDQFLQADEVFRRLTTDVNHKGKLVRQLQVSLRPGKDKPPIADKAAIVAQMRQLQTEIAALQKEQRLADAKLKALVCAIGNQLDPKLRAMYPALQKPRGSVSSRKHSFDTMNAMMQCTLHHFAKFPLHQLSQQHPFTATQMQALWGSATGLPSWLQFVAQQHHNTKTIFGAKQVPQYMGLVSSSSSLSSDDSTFDIVALTPSSLWDSRTIQLELLQDVLALQYLDDVEIVSSTDLELYEISRLEILSSATRQRVASISNYGDACSRACGMQYSGGGSRMQSKDFVHMVQARIYFAHVQPSESALRPYRIQQQMAASSGTIFAKKQEPKSIRMHTKFPVAKEDVQLEALSTPFEFLFGV